MSHIDFFKKQAKNFHKDWKTQKKIEEEGFSYYVYDWKYYHIEDLFDYFELSNTDREEIKLARAQHYIAKMVGFKTWNDLVHAPEKEVKLAEFLLRHFKNSYHIEDWENILSHSGVKGKDSETILDYAKQYYSMYDEDDEYGGKVPFDWDMDQGYISEYAYD